MLDLQDYTLKRYQFVTIDKSDNFREKLVYKDADIWYVDNDIDDYFVELLHQTYKRKGIEWGLVEGTRKYLDSTKAVIYAIIVQEREKIQNSKHKDKINALSSLYTEHKMFFKQAGRWKTNIY